MIVMGIDPGLSGAIAALDLLGGLEVGDMPVVQIDRNGKIKREVDAANLAALLRDLRPDHVFLERVGAMPGQGVTSMFAFGEGVGIVRGVIGAMGIPVSRVQPAVWKRVLGVPKGKDAARARATELLPAWSHRWPLKKHDGRAEAALLAEYGRRVLVGAATT